MFQKNEDDQLVRKLSWMGIDKDTYARDNGNYKWKYEVDYLGYKYNGNSIMAAIALVQLKYLDEDNNYRRQIAKWYDEYFDNSKKQIERIPITKGCECSRHLYIIAVDNRDKLITKLNENGIFPGVHYRDNTEYNVYNYKKGCCPYSKYMSERIISLPMHLRLTKRDIDYICNMIERYLGD